MAHAQQADWLQRQVAELLRAPDVKAVLVNTLADSQLAGSGGGYGITGRDLTPKPVFDRLAAAVTGSGYATNRLLARRRAGAAAAPNAALASTRARAPAARRAGAASASASGAAAWPAARAAGPVAAPAAARAARRRAPPAPVAPIAPNPFDSGAPAEDSFVL